MLKLKDIEYARKRKKLWDRFSWGYKSETQLSKRHSLKCNCSMCRFMIEQKRLAKKRNRISLKNETRNLLEND